VTRDMLLTSLENFLDAIKIFLMAGPS